MRTAFDTLVSTATKIPGQTLPMHLDGSRAIRGNGGAARIASLSRRAPDFRVVPDGKYLGIGYMSELFIGSYFAVSTNRFFNIVV